MKLEIPKISDERLLELATRIKPISRNENGELVYFKKCDLRNEAFTWIEPAEKVKDSLIHHTSIRTLHGYGYYGFFKPSIAEVISQIPEEFLQDVVAFETIGPSTVQEMNQEKEALNAGFHVATTNLYRKTI